LQRLDVERAVQALSRVGIDEVVGYLQWGMIDWRDAGLAVETVGQMTVHDLAAWHEQEQDVLVIDVREPFEWEAGHAPGAHHIPLGELGERQHELPEDQQILVICRSGARSRMVTDALNEANYPAANVDGGMGAWQAVGGPIERDDGTPGAIV